MKSTLVVALLMSAIQAQNERAVADNLFHNMHAPAS